MDSRLAAGFIQAAHFSGPNGKVVRVVIHGTVSPCRVGQAKNTANYFASAGSGGSAHYTVDPSEIWQSVKESVTAWHAPPNEGSIGIELCDPVAGDAVRWLDDNHDSMLRLTGRLLADVCARNEVPLVRLSVADLVAGKSGICGHSDISAAFHQSDHTDPGPGFPWDNLLSYAQPKDEFEMATLADLDAAVKKDGDITRKLVLGTEKPDGSDVDPGHPSLADIKAEQRKQRDLLGQILAKLK